MVGILTNRVPPGHTDSQVVILLPTTTVAGDIFLLGAVHTDWVVLLIPGLWIIMPIGTNHRWIAVMINFSGTGRKVSILPECLTEGDHIRINFAILLLLVRISVSPA